MLDRLRRLDRQAVRHVLMRAGLAFVLAWFGVNELRKPSDWAVFAPAFVVHHSPVAINTLVVLHGFLLVLAATFVLVGLFQPLAGLLSTGLMAEIMFGLWLSSGVSDLFVRDVGVLTLAVAVALDPVRAWQFEGIVPALILRLRGPDPRAAKGRKPTFWDSIEDRVAASIVLLAAVTIGAVILYGTGHGGAGLPQSSLAAAAANSRTSTSGGAASAGSASSGQTVTNILFNSWQYKSYAYQIYPGAPGADATKALAGFTLSTRDQGGTVVLSLKAKDPRYGQAQLSVQKNEPAYFVETSMRDDPADQENNTGDDALIAVNSNGYIVAP